MQPLRANESMPYPHHWRGRRRSTEIRSRDVVTTANRACVVTKLVPDEDGHELVIEDARTEAGSSASADTSAATAPADQARMFRWITCSADQREHAVPDQDPDRDTSPGEALCGHRVIDRPSSLLVPPGTRCTPCVSGVEQLRRAASPRPLQALRQRLRR